MMLPPRHRGPWTMDRPWTKDQDERRKDGCKDLLQMKDARMDARGVKMSALMDRTQSWAQG
eukprot:13916531-Alexandrium_andersonii.AAC.1